MKGIKTLTPNYWGLEYRFKSSKKPDFCFDSMIEAQDAEVCAGQTIYVDGYGLFDVVDTSNRDKGE